jgi:hypothetical protein
VLKTSIEQKLTTNLVAPITAKRPHDPVDIINATSAGDGVDGGPIL